MDLQMVRTKGSEMKNNNEFKAVVFISRKKSDLAVNEEKKTQGTQFNIGPEFDIKKATKEIIKLGAKGFYQRRRDRTLKSLAIELGAKPEKNRYHNYKELKEIRKKNRERMKERMNMLQESRNLSAINHYKAKKNKTKPNISILNKYGKRR